MELTPEQRRALQRSGRAGLFAGRVMVWSVVLPVVVFLVLAVVFLVLFLA